MAINKPRDYDTAQAWGEYSPLKPGGYVCVIKGAKETVSKAGNEMIEFIIDIAEGDEAGRFQKEYNNSNQNPKKWSNSATLRQLTLTKDGNTHGGFKNMVNAIEESNNTGAVWGDGFCDWMRGKMIGIVFCREQFRANDGSLKWSTKPFRGYKTVEQIRNGDYIIPEDIALEADAASYGNYDAPQSTLTDDDIPF